MKRTDFFKTLGALIIAPLAINSILKENGCLYDRDAVKKEMELDKDDYFCNAGLMYPLDGKYDFYPNVYRRWQEKYNKGFSLEDWILNVGKYYKT